MKRLLPVLGLLIFLSGVPCAGREAEAADTAINEFVPAPSAVSPEWVELYNASDSAEYLKSYFIDDDISFESDSGSTAKKVLTNLNCTDPHYPFYIFTSSMFNNDGDSVVLFDAGGAIVDQFTYFDNPGSDVPVGRAPDKTGSFAMLTSQTQGQGNASPVSTPTPTSVPTPTPTPTPTPAHSPTPTPVPTKTPTPTPTKTPTPAKPPPVQADRTPEGTSTARPVVLGAFDAQASPTPDAQKQSHTPVIISLCLIGAGLGILSLALVWQKRNEMFLTKKD